jgi:hypothetical protein
LREESSVSFHREDKSKVVSFVRDQRKFSPAFAYSLTLYSKIEMLVNKAVSCAIQIKVFELNLLISHKLLRISINFCSMKESEDVHYCLRCVGLLVQLENPFMIEELE